MSIFDENLLKVSYKSVYVQIPIEDVDAIDFVSDFLQHFRGIIVDNMIQSLVRKTFHRDVKQ